MLVRHDFVISILCPSRWHDDLQLGPDEGQMTTAKGPLPIQSFQSDDPSVLHSPRPISTPSNTSHSSQIVHHIPNEKIKQESRNERGKEGKVGGRKEKDAPLGEAKCNTFPSSLNMLTSSTPATEVTFSFLSAAWSFRSSP